MTTEYILYLKYKKFKKRSIRVNLKLKKILHTKNDPRATVF